ncbi:MAG: hypothetical protein DME26_07910 [Verrucomicrobia bacterium]|nr:MAG: hypothetical protein DME26_07910 [Verrucomicrobiota bacterium]
MAAKAGPRSGVHGAGPQTAVRHGHPAAADLVEKGSKIKSAKELWERDRIEDPLISLPTNESIYQNFQAGLMKLGVDWFSGIEVSTIDLVETYVANGYGIGLSIAVPKKKQRPELRALPLDDFPSVSFGMFWQGKPTPILEAFLAASQQAAQVLMS